MSPSVNWIEPQVRVTCSPESTQQFILFLLAFLFYKHLFFAKLAFFLGYFKPETIQHIPNGWKFIQDSAEIFQSDVQMILYLVSVIFQSQFEFLPHESIAKVCKKIAQV